MARGDQDGLSYVRAGSRSHPSAHRPLPFACSETQTHGPGLEVSVLTVGVVVVVYRPRGRAAAAFGGGTVENTWGAVEATTAYVRPARARRGGCSSSVAWGDVRIRNPIRGLAAV